jgi:hypothetical protein
MVCGISIQMYIMTKISSTPLMLAIIVKIGLIAKDWFFAPVNIYIWGKYVLAPSTTTLLRFSPLKYQKLRFGPLNYQTVTF